MVSKTSIPAKNQKKVIQESGGVCGFCGETDVATLEFHHINGRDIDDPHNVENLIYACKNCHGKITAGFISLSDVVLQKRILKYSGNPKFNQASENTINLNGGVNTGTIANVIHIHVRKKTPPKIPPPQGSIGTNLNNRNYVKHLIEHYHEFAKAEKSNTYKYPVLYQSIKRKFGAKWDMIPNNRFEDVVSFLQKRIDGTILGKTRKSKGQKNYSTYSEFLEKYVKS